MDVSVIIPTYNNGGVLARTLGALLTQTFPPDRYEIVIIDDGSTDGTAEMVGRLRGPVAIRYVAQPKSGRAAARNLGARVARGRILLFLDSDFFADPALVAERGARVALLPLPRLIELKLASGMTAPHRLKDLADVQELIRAASLSHELADTLDRYVRDKYLELWQAVHEHPEE